MCVLLELRARRLDPKTVRGRRNHRLIAISVVGVVAQGDADPEPQGGLTPDAPWWAVTPEVTGSSPSLALVRATPALSGEGHDDSRGFPLVATQPVQAGHAHVAPGGARPTLK